MIMNIQWFSQYLFYGMNQKIQTKKSLFSYFQLIPILRFQVMPVSLLPKTDRLLCWIKFRTCTRLSVKIALISYWNDFCLIPLGSVLLRGELWKYAKIFKFWQFWECPLFDIREYAFKYKNILYTFNSFVRYQDLFDVYTFNSFVRYQDLFDVTRLTG